MAVQVLREITSSLQSSAHFTIMVDNYLVSYEEFVRLHQTDSIISSALVAVINDVLL